MGRLLGHAFRRGGRSGTAGMPGPHLLQREAETALRESEERDRAFADAMREGVAIHHLGRIVDANAAFWRMFGYASLQEVIGHEILDFVAPEFREDALRSASHGDGRPYQGRGLRADESTFPAEFQGSPVAYRQQGMRVLLVRDCTSEEEARLSLWANERNLRLTLGTLDLGAFTSRTPEGVVTDWSAGCERIFGWRASEAVGYGRVPPRGVGGGRLDEGGHHGVPR